MSRTPLVAAAPNARYVEFFPDDKVLNFRLLRDVAPGEVVYIDVHGRLHSQVCVATARHAPCISIASSA